MKKKLLLIVTIALFSFIDMKAQNDCNTAVSAVAGINTAGTIVGSLQDVCGTADASTVATWFEYYAANDGIVTVSANLPQNDGTTNSDDTFINVYSGSCGALVCVASNDDVDVAGGNYLSEVTFIVASGSTYYFEWTDQWNDSGFDFELTETVVTCPGTVTAPFVEEFSDANQIYVCWDFIDSDGDGNNWYIADYDLDQDNNPDGNPCLVSASYDNDTGILNPDNWIISYPIDLSAFDANYDITLEWLARGIDPGYADENYTVYVATGNQDTDFLASSTNFTEIIGQNGGAGQVFVSRSLDISSFYGQTIYVAFRHYNSSDEFQLNIDDVAVTATLSATNFSLNNFNYSYDKATKNLTISSEKENLKSIEIYNLVGQKVITTTATSENSKAINLSNLNDGVYVVNVLDATNNFKSFKFIKN